MSNNNITDYTKITGKGLVFPIKIDEKGKAIISTGVELILSSIKNLLGYEYGTRYFLGEFGLALKSQLDEPNDDVLISILEYRFSVQIPQWDKRIRLTDLTLTRVSASQLNINIEVQIVGTNIRESFVYPYFIESQY